MIPIIVGVFVSDTMSEAFMSTIMGVLEMHRNCGLLSLYAAHGFLNGIHCGITLRCTGHVGNSLGKDDLGFRHSYPLHSLGSSCCHADSLGICISDILGGQDHDPPCNKLHIFPCVEHFCQIINCRIRV